MALKKTIKTAFGLECKDAYHRVERMQIDQKTRIAFRVRAYADVDAQPLADDGFVCDYDLNGKNPIAQAYEFLKTTSEFQNAQDC